MKKYLIEKKAARIYEEKKKDIEELKRSLNAMAEKASTIKELEEIEQKIGGEFSKIV